MIVKRNKQRKESKTCWLLLSKMASKRKLLTLQEKVDLIWAGDVSGTKQTNLATRLGVSKSQVSRIMTQKKEILAELLISP